MLRKIKNEKMQLKKRGKDRQVLDRRFMSDTFWILFISRQKYQA